MHAKMQKRGFTLIELLIVIAFLAAIGFGIIYYGLIVVVAQGNFWVSQASALECVQFIKPDATRVVRLQRNVFDPSVVTVEDAEGKRTDFLLDTDVLQNAECTPAAGAAR